MRTVILFPSNVIPRIITKMLPALSSLVLGKGFLFAWFYSPYDNAAVNHQHAVPGEFKNGIRLELNKILPNPFSTKKSWVNVTVPDCNLLIVAATKNRRLWAYESHCSFRQHLLLMKVGGDNNWIIRPRNGCHGRNAGPYDRRVISQIFRCPQVTCQSGMT